jgi:hypothetical protein
MKLTMSWGKFVSKTAGSRLDVLLPVLLMTLSNMKLGWRVWKPEILIGEALNVEVPS